RDGAAFVGGSNRAAADQLVSVLNPHSIAAREQPCCTSKIVGRSAHDGGIAVVRQRDGGALKGDSNRAAADQLASLLRPHPTAAGERPHRTGIRVTGTPAHDRGVAVSR